MKVLLIILSLIPLLFYGQEIEKETFLRSISNSEIKIIGKSNVAGYKCLLYDLSNNTNIKVQSKREGLNVALEDAILKLKSNGFRCNKKPITKDFLKTIKAQEHLYIVIEFIRFTYNEDPEKQAHQKDINAEISISIAGVKRNYSILVSRLDFNKNSISIKGNKKIFMSDFNLIAPSALFGTIKAKDEINLEFTISFLVN